MQSFLSLCTLQLTFFHLLSGFYSFFLLLNISSRNCWFKLDDETVKQLETNEEFDPDKEKEIHLDKKQLAGLAKKFKGKGKGKQLEEQLNDNDNQPEDLQTSETAM